MKTVSHPIQTVVHLASLGGLLLLLAACDSTTRPDQPAPPLALEQGTQPVARIQGQQAVLLQAENQLAALLAAHYARGNPETPAPALDQVWIETGPAYTYLMARGKDGQGRCLTLATELNVQNTLATLAKTEAGVIFIEACLSPDGTCPQSGCITTKDERGKIIDCMCIPAGNCQRVVIPIPILF